MVVAVDSEGDRGRLFFFSGECIAAADLVDIFDEVDMSSSLYLVPVCDVSLAVGCPCC